MGSTLQEIGPECGTLRYPRFSPSSPHLIQRLREASQSITVLAFTAAPVKDHVAKYYDQNFSESELEELIAFFAKPVGKKFASKGSSLSDGLPLLAARLLTTVAVQGTLRLGLHEVTKRGRVIPKVPAP